ncbi:GntR family transcriptional regulator [Mycolicibacterium smegmatis]|uniref:Transcriptional regulator, GntR family protein n=1 Tax=Mycolicibacterium smegmatis (strain MKD8) TaxID=1214915 RepID=A0A2U9PTA7_MYCSE|nr:GntR family transcriptional regulator [Mycolicibacterium smegmatis]AWT54997.1 transcriptional regulator, GntR family protein [Mycolicibacterium smegmatis MKD8]
MSPTPDPQSAVPAREIAYRIVYDAIASGRYLPGQWIREDEVTAEAGVSRTPLREALQRLQSEGLVQLVRHRGALVVGWTSADLDDLFDIRVALETYGARRAAQRRGGAQLESLQKLCASMDEILPAAQEPELQRLGHLCIDFHRGIHEAADNRKLLSVMPMVLAPPFVSEAFHHHTRLELEQAFAHHRELVEAIAIGDEDWAEGVMRAHLRHGRRSLRRMERHLPLMTSHDAEPAVTDTGQPETTSIERSRTRVNLRGKERHWDA